MVEAFLHHLRVRSVEAEIVEVCQGQLVLIAGKVLALKSREATRKSIQVNIDGEVTIHGGVFGA